MGIKWEIKKGLSTFWTAPLEPLSTDGETIDLWLKPQADTNKTCSSRFNRNLLEQVWALPIRGFESTGTRSNLFKA